MLRSRDIKVGVVSSVVAASIRGCDRRAHLVIVVVLDAFFNIRSDGMYDVLQFLITRLFGVLQTSSDVSLDIHLATTSRVRLECRRHEIGRARGSRLDGGDLRDIWGRPTGTRAGAGGEDERAGDNISSRG